MPAPATIADFLELVTKSGLVESGRLQATMQDLYGPNPPEDPNVLADHLVEVGVLTRFQAKQFLLGKWRGFTLGKYRVLEQLGRGGMGTVYLCEHQLMQHRVAIKVLPTNRAKNPSLLGRFYREARAGGALDHPNLVKAHDVDQEGNLHFLIMEYVDGSSFHDIVSRFGPFSVPQAAHYIAQAACGLHHAHTCGLIHRDVKPANVLVERSGNVRVLDLGLARFCNDEDLLTLKYDDNSVLGTADYVSPEQADDSHEVDHRADVYSLGCTFFYVLTGRPPFPDGPVAQKLIWHQMREPTLVNQIRPDVPAEMAAIIARMLAKDPEDRFQTLAEVVDALSPWTREPIPPPSAEEMPHLCPAANKHASRGMITPVRVPKVSLPLSEEESLHEAQPAPLRPRRVVKPAVLINDPTPARVRKSGTVPTAQRAKRIAPPDWDEESTSTAPTRVPGAPSSTCDDPYAENDLGSEITGYDPPRPYHAPPPGGFPSPPDPSQVQTMSAWVLLTVLVVAAAVGLLLHWLIPF